MKPLDIAIAGCGPAGLAAALLLSRDRHRVTLFERFDKPRPIGSGLMIQPTGLAVLRVLGLAERIVAQGARIDRLFGQTASGRTVLDVRYGALGKRAGFGTGVHRALLFNELYGAVTEAGIAIETGRAIAGSELGAGGRRHLAFSDGGRAGPFDLVVDALGSGTPLAPRSGRILPYGAFWASLDRPAEAGFDDHALEQRYVRASRMAGVMPMGRAAGAAASQTAFFWSLRLDQLAAWRSAGIDRWKSEVRALWPETAPLLDQIATEERLTFARYTHRSLRKPAETGLIHIGDAWHSASPQLGQGANMAFLDALALTQALRGAKEVPEALERAVAMRRLHVAIYQGMSALFTPVYQSDSRILPVVRDWIVGPLAPLWPASWIQAAMVSGLIGRPLARLGLSPEHGDQHLRSVALNRLR